MRKTIPMILALILMVILGAAVAEGEGMLQPVYGDWGDENYDKVYAEVYPATLQGTGIENGICIDVTWGNGADSDYVYQLTMEPESGDENSIVYAYTGIAMVREYNDQGEIEKQEDLDDPSGTATFTAQADGRVILVLNDSIHSALNDIRFEKMPTPAPEAEIIARDVLLSVFEMNGSEESLQEVVVELTRFAANWNLYSVDEAALKAEMAAALESMNWSEEERQAYLAHEAAVTELLEALAGLDDPDPEEYAQTRQKMGNLLEVFDSISGNTVPFSMDALCSQLAAMR